MMLNPLQAFVLHKNIPWAEIGPTKQWFSDESSLFTVWGPFVAQGMFFVQNKCVQWIQHHDKPLVRPLTSYLKQIFFWVFSSCIESRWETDSSG